MTDERKDVARKVENPWNELKPSEARGVEKDAEAAPKPGEKLAEGSYGELNYTNADGSDAKGE